MGRVFLINLEGYVYYCNHCHTSFVLLHDIISRNFTCTTGTAYFCDKVVNVTVGEKYDQSMMTGRYTTVDIFCVKCGSGGNMMDQKYKEGKFVLERRELMGPDSTYYVRLPLLADA